VVLSPIQKASTMGIGPAIKTKFGLRQWF